MNIYWKKVEGGATSEFAEIEDYIDESLTVWVPHPRKKEEHWMYPGVHEYPFTYDLPMDCPETLEDSRYATLTYTVKSTVYMTMGRTSSSLDETIHVQALPDPSVPIPADEDLPKVKILLKNIFTFPSILTIFLSKILFYSFGAKIQIFEKLHNDCVKIQIFEKLQYVLFFCVKIGFYYTFGAKIQIFQKIHNFLA